MNRIKIRDGFEHEVFIDVPDNLINWQRNEPLFSELFITSIGFFPNAKFHYCTRPSGSESPILIYCTQGQGHVELDNKKITVDKDQLIIIPRNTPHTYYASLANPWSIYWSQFDGAVSDAYVSIIQPEYNAITIVSKQQQYLIRYFNEMIDLMSNGFSKDHLLHCNNLHKTMFSLINHRSFSHNSNRSSQSEYTRMAIEYMLTHLSKHITIPELAEAVGLSISHFQHLFKEKTGLAPIEYVNSLRVQKACELLATTDMPIKTIALQVGFKDPYYFSRAFKKVMSVTPRYYRQTSKR